MKEIDPDKKIPIKLSESKINFIKEKTMYDSFADSDMLLVLNKDGKVEMTYGEWDELIGFINAESNHSNNRIITDRLDAISDYLEEKLNEYFDDEDFDEEDD